MKYKRNFIAIDCIKVIVVKRGKTEINLDEKSFA